MALTVGRPASPSLPSSQSLPVSWDVTLQPAEVQLVDLDRRAAKADLTLSVPLSRLGLTPKQAKQLFDGAELAYVAPGAGDVKPQVSIKGDKLVLTANGIDGRGFFAAAPRLALKGKDGVARTMTFRTPTATLREKDPEVRAGWGGAGLKEHLAVEKRVWGETKTRLSGERRAVKDEFQGPERRERLRDLRQEKRELKSSHREQVQQIRSDIREQRHDRRAAEKRDRRGQITVDTKQV